MSSTFDCSDTSVRHAWEHFSLTGEVSGAVRPVVRESWLRCYRAGLDARVTSEGVRVSTAELGGRIATCEGLLAVAVPIMRELQTLVTGSGFLTMLTDRDGVILEILSDEVDRADLGQRQLTQGGVWNETVTGTSAIGLVLIHSEAFQIIGAEHYYQVDHELTCSAAPVYNHEGELIGVLNMSGRAQLAHPHSLGMVVASAKAITNQLRIEEDHRQLWLAHKFLNSVIETISDGVVAIDARGRVREVNREAARILRVEPAGARGAAVETLFAGQGFLLDVIRNGRELSDDEVIVETGRGQIEFHVTAQPIRLQDGRVAGVVATLKESRKLHRVVNRIHGAEASFTFRDIVGSSDAIVEARGLAKAAARGSSTVLIQGESGTGKELFAQAIHNEGEAHRPFIAVNCAAIPETLIESELFGYESGAFTGAARNGRPGKFELANGGTIFLDEIADLPLYVQGALLRVLQERSVVRVGGARPIPLDLRVIAATNKNLEEETRNGNFREDLYYRLNVFLIRTPALRERSEDIPEFVHHFVAQIGQRFGKNVVGVAPDVMKRLVSWDWPGNIRQLQNVIERAINMVEGPVISMSTLPVYLRDPHVDDPVTRDVTISIAEKSAIEEALRMYDDRRAAARALGISRSTLYRKLRKYRLG
jgi:sigma-54 dependent transcriptional regulator, acetoin dehydrogenase operon transcriptional activator AcoR